MVSNLEDVAQKINHRGSSWQSDGELGGFHRGRFIVRQQQKSGEDELVVGERERNEGKKEDKEPNIQRRKITPYHFWKYKEKSH